MRIVALPREWKKPRNIIEYPLHSEWKLMSEFNFFVLLLQRDSILSRTSLERVFAVVCDVLLERCNMVLLVSGKRPPKKFPAATQDGSLSGAVFDRFDAQLETWYTNHDCKITWRLRHEPKFSFGLQIITILCSNVLFTAK